MRNTIPFPEVIRQFVTDPANTGGQLPSALDQISHAGNTTDAFRTITDPALVTQVIIAGHQEQGFIKHTLEQFAAETDKTPRHIVVNCNTPTGETDRSATVIRAFMAAHDTTVPLGYFTSESDRMSVNRQLAAKVALSACRKSNRQDVLTHSEDGDTRYVRPSLYGDFMRVLEMSTAEQPATVITTHHRFERLRDPVTGDIRFPYMDGVIKWAELSPHLKHAWYEPGHAISARAAIEAGFYNHPDHPKEGPTNELLNRIFDYNAMDDPAHIRLPGVGIRTSARRQYLLMGQGAVKAGSFWPGAFSSTADYRNTSLMDLPDISQQARDEQITGTAIRIATNVPAIYKRRGMTPDVIAKKIGAAFAHALKLYGGPKPEALAASIREALPDGPSLHHALTKA